MLEEENDEHFAEKTMEVVMIAAQYFQLAMPLNSFAVQVEPELCAELEKTGRCLGRFAPRKPSEQA